MKLKFLVTLFGLLMAFHLQADQINEGDSPSRKIHFEVKPNNQETKDIWLSPKDHKDNAVKLCETPGWGNLNIHFSPDDFWIIVEDGGASLGIHLTLFQRVKGVNFKEMKDVDIEGKAIQFAMKQNGLLGEGDLDHQYVHVLNWSSDSKFILISVSGAGRRDKYGVSIAGWNVIYNLGTGQFSFDLNKINAGAVEKSRN